MAARSKFDFNDKSVFFNDVKHGIQRFHEV